MPKVLSPKRAGFYFDGFNFYHAIVELRRNHLKWMSYAKLAELLSDREERVEFVKVFSAYADQFRASAARHRIYTIALESESVQCIMGQFKEKRVRCNTCKQTDLRHEEKESDVSLAVHLLNDCAHDRLDVAYIVTTDSDLAPAVRMVKAEYPRIELVAVSTPGRGHCYEIASVCHRSARARPKQLPTCLLPKVIKDALGTVLAIRPPEYDPPS